MNFVEAVIPFEQLLAPLPGDNPAGQDLTYTVWNDLQNLRREEDRQGESKTVQWASIAATATEALKDKTKDLRIAFYLAEAIVKEHGLAGLRDGLQLLRKMIADEQLWQHAYPVVRNGNFKARASALRLNDKLDLAVQQIALTSTVVGESYCYLQWKESEQFKIPENVEGLEPNEQERVKALRESAAAENKITNEQWRSAVKGTSPHLFVQAFTLLEESRAELITLEATLEARFTPRVRPGLEELKQSLDEALTAETPNRAALQAALNKVQAELEDAPGLSTFKTDLTRRLSEAKIDQDALKRFGARLIVREAPPLAALKTTLDALRDLIEPLAPKDGDTQEGTDADPKPTTKPDAPLLETQPRPPQPQAPPPPVRAINNRQEAIDHLAGVLAYFRQAEPYNPASNLIERAINWGNLSLEQWLAQTIGDDSLRKLQERLGVGSNQSSSNGDSNHQSPNGDQAIAMNDDRVTEANDQQTTEQITRPLPLSVPLSLSPLIEINHRKDALARLKQVVAYFREMEPHNPAICLVERAIAWSDLPLEQWLAQVIEDGEVLNRLQWRLGGKPGAQAK